MGSKDITTPSPQVLAKLYQAKKGLGQNFLINESLIEKIANTVLEQSPEAIIEIGPGLGAFTQKFVQAKIPTVAVEIDQELYPYLEDTFPTLTLHKGDILQTTLEQLIKTYNLPSNTYVFGALPYNISKPIIRRTIEDPTFTKGSFIIQKEVAQKYIATVPKNNKLSLLSRIYAKAIKRLDISAGNFKPPPNVTSSLISFEKGTPIKDTDSVVKLKILIKQAFTNPRKTLYNNIKSLYPTSDQHALAKERPSRITLEQYQQLLKDLEKDGK